MPVAAFLSGRLFLEASESANWPTVIGTMRRAEVRRLPLGKYEVDVSYDYSINDTLYIGSRICASDGQHKYHSDAEYQLRGLHVGKLVTVHYDPTSPSRSVLRAGAGFQEYVLLIVPFMCFGMGLRRLKTLRDMRAYSNQ
ncbi:MAG: DUF3592 domain-containing protein [Pirellulales bacterium]|nr:DUF3592 domain-containing protein [Pirellulales bacterium]